ncbi:MAG: glycosyltransferase family 4 protein [Verrucomicrobia bacterium]|nr:glycosyltransferase family 4 protein [Verrucomicrobiota bacterium]
MTRGILMALLSDPPSGYRVEAVRAVSDGYVYARRYISSALDLSEKELTDDKLEVTHGDVFLGVDWPADVLPSLESWFREKQRQGLRITFVLYDLLPLLRPELFPPELSPMVLRWLKTVTKIADGIVCISRTVADELSLWLNEKHSERLLPLSIGFFQLGSDLHTSLPTKGFPEGSQILLKKINSRMTFLVVGTVEPRKGHRQMLAAMESLWAESHDVNLVIVGKKGWMMDDFSYLTLNHPEYNKRLFWLQAISDEMLDSVYKATDALVIPSEGEGFGLPLVEAAKYGIPIVARGLPVFREVAGEHALYFDGKEPEALAEALRKWLSLGAAAPASAGIRCLTWKESCIQLLDVVLGDRWHRTFSAFDHQKQTPAYKNSRPVAQILKR